MSDELLWTDTAREDWERLGPGREALLERVTGSPGDDHVLTAGQGFELRYQKQDGVFIFFRREAGTVTILYACEMTAAQRPGEVSVQVLDLQTRDVPNGMEAEGTYAYTGEDGSTTVRHHFVRIDSRGRHKFDD